MSASRWSSSTCSRSSPYPSSSTAVVGLHRLRGLRARARLERGGDRRAPRCGGARRGRDQPRAGRARPAPARRDPGGGQPRGRPARRRAELAGRGGRPARAARDRGRGEPGLPVRVRFPGRRQASREPAFRVGRGRDHGGARQPADAGHVLRRGRARARSRGSGSGTSSSPARCATSSPEERAVFDAQGILAVATVPIFVDGMWWGFIGFDDCETERTWSPSRAGRVADGLEPARRRQSAASSPRPCCASTSRSSAPSSKRRSMRSSSPTTSAATSTSIPPAASTSASPNAT